MTLRSILFFLAILIVVSKAPAIAEQPETSQSNVNPPNIVFIMSDELAYFELSHMGNPYIRTPNIDQMAAEGIRFTQALAAAPVCAPLRGALMTGKHMGHASVRANGGGTPLRADEVTIASMLKQKSYATGGLENGEPVGAIQRAFPKNTDSMFSLATMIKYTHILFFRPTSSETVKK